MASGAEVFGQGKSSVNEKRQDETLTYTNIIKLRKNKRVSVDLAPIMRIVSPLADSEVAPGEGMVGAGSRRN